ncbi:hypothetical protein OEZ85_002945 [Tetradesmus obliquus]|uniref:BRCT domain-containing protein n=1 Tax=Tetradesmus obliquus TaxID=3088 RepID=A0ABY8TZX3_TETOB|nr:hypothetical protein OEZ85_002945 [Tetradesmus obliquus]
MEQNMFVSDSKHWFTAVGVGAAAQQHKRHRASGFVQVVGAAWVHACLDQQRRVGERKFYVAKPQEPLLQLGKSPATGGKSAKKRRAARGAAHSRKVAEAAALDVDEFQFNSSQQLQELRSGWHQQHAPQAAAAAAAEHGPLGQQQQQQWHLPQQRRGLTARQAAAARSHRGMPPPSSASAGLAAAAAATRAGLTASHQQQQQQQQQQQGWRGFGAGGLQELGPATQLAADLLDAAPESGLQGSAFGDPPLLLHALGGDAAAAAAEEPDGELPSLTQVIQQQQQQQQKV